MSAAAQDAAPVRTMPDLSVVVPTRGRRELVRLAVAGIVAQDYDGHIECYVVHDQEEPDVELEAMGRPDRRITVLRNTGDLGLAGSRNFGLTRVRTEFVRVLRRRRRLAARQGCACRSSGCSQSPDMLVARRRASGC